MNECNEYLEMLDNENEITEKSKAIVKALFETKTGEEVVQALSYVPDENLRFIFHAAKELLNNRENSNKCLMCGDNIEQSH